MIELNQIRKHKTLLPAAALILFSACADKSPVTTAEAPQPSVPQEVRFVVKGPAAEGSATSEGAVFAEFGIAFRLAGGFEVGPAPNGQLHGDELSSQERDVLNTSWQKLQQSGFTRESCIKVAETSPVASLRARVSVLQNEREAALFRIDGGQICGPAESSILESFSTSLVELAIRHYPKQFPDACLAATDELKTGYRELTSCEADTDCANLDPQFFPIPSGQIQYVQLKSCSVIPTIAAANAASIQAARRALLSARHSARQACEATNQSLVCTTEADIGFQNHRYPARCTVGKCVPGKSLR